MFLTRSIRRKLACVLAGVLVMVVLLAGGSVWSLMAYRSLVASRDLDERDAGSAADLATALAKLRQAMRAYVASDSELDRTEVAQHAETALATAESYRHRLDAFPAAVQHRNAVAWGLLRELEPRLRVLSQRVASKSALHPTKVLDEVESLEAMALDLPEFPDRLKQRLRAARDSYRSGYFVVGFGSVLAIGLLVWLVRFCYRQVFQPIHELHQGARRVAQGDFDYRVPIHSDDEVGELADAFNQMTARFQEIALDLDGQVKARSQQLVRSERLASVGFLAAGVAHEVNNPLTAIRWTAESLEQRITELLSETSNEDASIVQRYVRMIQSESERCQEITRKLLDFSRGQDSQKTLTDVAAIVREVVTLIGHMKKYRAAKLLFDHPEACVIEINGHEIKQVMLNLLANALDATSGTGLVDVSLHENVDDVEIRVTDNGCGMTAETIENLFQPFFTTKGPGEGTGLGLSISHRIVMDHLGRLEVHSAGPGCGSTFTVRLPRQRAPRSHSYAPSSGNLAKART